MPRIRRLLTLAALVLLLPLLAACGGEPDAGPDLADSPLIGAWENAAGTRVEFRADGTYERSSGETGLMWVVSAQAFALRCRCHRGTRR